MFFIEKLKNQRSINEYKVIIFIKKIKA